MDAYCGWCWGFSERMSQFEAANRERVAFTAISGGLFTGDRAGPIARYAHIPEANARIAQLTGAVFSEDYQALVQQGDFVMNSADAAAALAALRAQAPEHAAHWANKLLEAFYFGGLSLSEPKTVADIASNAGLNAELAVQQFLDGSAHSRGKADFVLAKNLGAVSYPTLLYVDGPSVHQLPATGASLETLNAKLDGLLN